MVRIFEFKFFIQKINLKRLKKILKPLAEFGIGSIIGIAQRKIFEHSLTVFCYHDVTNFPSDFSRENLLNVPPEVFNYQISFIKNNFNLIKPSQLMEEHIPSNAALVTFDDGFKSFFTNAIPILEKYKIPVIIFLNMGPLKGEMFWPGLIVYLCKKEPEFIKFLNSKISIDGNKIDPFFSCSRKIVQKYLEEKKEDLRKTIADYVGVFADENDLEQFCENKNVFYGNHSYTHYISSLMTEKEFIEDIEKNTKLLIKYPNYIDFFAFPFGQPDTTFNEHQIQLLLNKEFRKVFSSSSSFINHSPIEKFLDRICLGENDNSSSKIKYKVIKPWFLEKIKAFSNKLLKH